MDHRMVCYLTLLTLTIIESAYTPSGSHRFPHLQRVADRLATETRQYSSSSPYHHRNTESPYVHRHQKVSPASDEDYDDEDDDEEEEEEVATARPRNLPIMNPNTKWDHETIAETSTMSVISNYKWNQWGRREKVDEGFKNSRTSSPRSTPKHSGEDDRKAVKHAMRISLEAQCKLPRSKLVRVSDMYASAGKAYVPQCTILHRCGNDTGCCRTGLTCAVKKSEQVELLFQSTFHGGAYTVEKLTFTNHTECECQNDRDEMMPRDMEVGGGYQPVTSTTSALPSSRSGSCRCTKLFAARRLPSGTCSCDCFDNDRDCLRQKKGKEYLTHDDKLCIARRLCQSPACEYGSYRIQAGRCAKKHEKFHTEY